MTEELNHHNDPAGISAAAQAAARPGYLGDMDVVDRLVREFGAAILDRFEQVGHGLMERGAATAAIEADCDRLAGIFNGEDPEVHPPVDGWNGAGLAAYIRPRMAALINDGDDRDVLKQVFATFALHTFDLLRGLGNGAPPASLQTGMSENVRSLSWLLLGVDTDD